MICVLLSKTITIIILKHKLIKILLETKYNNNIYSQRSIRIYQDLLPTYLLPTHCYQPTNLLYIKLIIYFNIIIIKAL